MGKKLTEKCQQDPASYLTLENQDTNSWKSSNSWKELLEIRLGAI